MNARPDFETHQSTINRLKSGIDRSVGALETLEAREKSLVASIASAKRRALAKPLVDKFLQNLQIDTHRRTIGGYERMLSALAQDVLGQNVRISLELGTERGLPSLNINAEHHGAVASVMDGCGGSLNNVVSFGLRAIALRKSGLRFFMALDEADCWLKPGRVELFYSVMKALAFEAKMQALVITHHPVDTFDEGVTVIRLDGSEERGVIGATHLRSIDWPDTEMEGIRSLRLRNFSSVGDVTLKVGPGLTALIGDNNIGKSRFMRALRVVFYGESEDADIRHGCKAAHVEIGMERGRTLFWTREKDGSPVTRWRLVERDGQVAMSDGVECSSGGRAVPDWVRKECRIGRVEDLDLQLPRQTTPIFLLSDTPSKRAQVLSVGRESGHLRNMIEQHRKDSTSDNALANKGEIELGELRAKIAQLRHISGLSVVVGELQADLDAAIRIMADAEAGAAQLQALEAAMGRLARAQAVQASLAGLPDQKALDTIRQAHGAVVQSAEAVERLDRAEAALRRAMTVQAALSDLPAMPDTPLPVTEILTAGMRIKTAEDAWRKAWDLHAALQDLPAMPAPPAPVEPALRAITEIEAREQKLAEASARREEIAASLRDTRAELEELIQQQGGACPLCGGALTIEHLERKVA